MIYSKPNCCRLKPAQIPCEKYVFLLFVPYYYNKNLENKKFDLVLKTSNPWQEAEQKISITLMALDNAMN